jgi:hypothetical protein
MGNCPGGSGNMLNLFLKLIDYFVDFAKQREELKRAEYDDIVAPVFEAFEAMHQNYVDALESYIGLLNDRVYKINTEHPVLRKLKLDALKGAHLRAKLKALLPDSSSTSAHAILEAMNQYTDKVSDTSQYVELLNGYLASWTRRVGEGRVTALISEIEGRLARYDNTDSSNCAIATDPVRESLNAILVTLDSFEDSTQWMPEPYQRELRDACVGAVEFMMRQVQEGYFRVAGAFGSLRAELLQKG